MKKVIILMLCIMMMQRGYGQLPDAHQLMEKSRDLSMNMSLNTTMNLVITEKNGTERNRTIEMTSKSFPGGAEKRLMKFIEPADVRGTAMLIIDNKATQDEMWIYLPALKRTRRIVSNEKGKSFMSSEFSNADMTSPSLSDFKISHSPASGQADQWIIESRPVDTEKENEYGYSRMLTYLNKENLKVNKMEYFNNEGNMFKTITVNATKNVGSDGKYIITDLVAVNKTNGRSSRIRFNNVVTDTDFPDNRFTVDMMTK